MNRRETSNKGHGEDWTNHRNRIEVTMKAMTICVLLAMGLPLKSGAMSLHWEKFRKLSENGGPLKLLIIESRATSESQNIGQQTGLAFPPGAFNAFLNNGGGTYRGPMDPVYDFKPITPPPKRVFLIVRVRVLGVLKHKLLCGPSDFVLVTQSGGRFTPIGEALAREGYWLSLVPNKLNPAPGWNVLDRKQLNVFTWLFVLDSNSLDGETLQLQDARVQIPGVHRSP